MGIDGYCLLEWTSTDRKEKMTLHWCFQDVHVDVLGHLEVAGGGPVINIWRWQFSPRWAMCSAMNGNGRGNALVSGKEDKGSLAGSSRNVPIAGEESELRGKLGEMYPVVSRGHMQVRVTSGRSWPVHCCREVWADIKSMSAYTFSFQMIFVCQNQKGKRKIWALWHFGDVRSENAGQQPVIPC